VKEIDKLSGILLEFAFMLRSNQFHPHEDDLMYRRLCSEPAIQSALRRLRKGRRRSLRGRRQRLRRTGSLRT
jgi:hypothetical protein